MSLVDCLVYSLLPVAHAHEIDLAHDNTPGGQLIHKCLTSLTRDLRKELPLYLTPKGVDATVALTKMLNCLATSHFKNDQVLYTFLSSVESEYSVHYSKSRNSIVPNNSYSLPLKHQKVLSAHDSGIYGFFLEDKLGLGSAISCRARLTDHMASFNGNRRQHFMHQYVRAKNALPELTLSPLITTPNLVHE